MDLLINKIQEHLNKPNEKEHIKNSFWCSETEAPIFDIYHKWIGTPPTNISTASCMLIMNTGKMVELSLCDTLNDLGLIEFNPDQPQRRVEMKRLGVPITGYIDAVLKDKTVAEIKSFYGDYQTKDLKEGKARTSYLKQLACYMDFLNVSLGRLIYIHRGTGEMFEFILERLEGLKFKCRDIEFDLEDVYRRWSELYFNHILPKIEPKSEFRYKIPVDEIDWTKISNADISKARTGKKVIGDGWQVAYSPYKDLIIQREGSTLGYTDEELKFICEKTAGYSSKKK